MASPENQADNPYRAPMTDPSPLGDIPAGPVDPNLIKNFRQQIHALGAFWIFIGAAAIGLFAFAAGGGDMGLSRGSAGGLGTAVLALILAVPGGCWLVLGVLTCLKRLWAVYAALVLSYLSLAGQALQLSACSIAILVVVILQAHRVIGWAKRMRAAGIPLTAKP